jgi:hypothetical protein
LSIAENASRLPLLRHWQKKAFRAKAAIGLKVLHIDPFLPFHHLAKWKFSQMPPPLTLKSKQNVVNLLPQTFVYCEGTFYTLRCKNSGPDQQIPMEKLENF